MCQGIRVPKSTFGSTGPLFTENHLSYVVSSPENLRAYFVESLGISGEFMDHFTIHDWSSALEHTLYCRPPEVPTEVYLKSQHLWIMHKLLIRIGLRDRIHTLMNFPFENGSLRDELVGGRCCLRHPLNPPCWAPTAPLL